MKKLVLFFSLCTLAVMMTAPTAQAGNIVPNPDFVVCPSGTSGPPGGWMPWPASGATVVCNATGNGDTSSMLVSGAVFFVAQSVCVNTPGIAAGSHAASFAYNASAVVSGVALYAFFHSGAGCGGGPFGDLNSPAAAVSKSPPISGAWDVVSGTISVPSGTQSVQFAFEFDCGVGSSCGSTTIRFDDAFFETPTTAVTFASLSAARSAKGVVVRWHTGSETQMLGFEVYREQKGRRVRLNTRLIAARGRGAYTFLDRRAPRGQALRYWIRVVNLDGSRSWHGPAHVLGRAR